MATITISIPVPDDLARFFAGRDMIVTPGTDEEIEQFMIALVCLANAIETIRKALSTLQQLSETKGASAVHIGQTLDMLVEPCRLAGEYLEFIRVFLGRSARAGRMGPMDGETLQ